MKIPFLKDKQSKYFDKMAPMYAIVPQMRDYHLMTKFRGMWLPQVMTSHQPHFTSPSVCTDAYGFRLTYDRNGELLPLARSEREEVNVIVGGSSACGVGSSSDRQTIASLLSARMNSDWHNFGVIRHNLSQSLAFFMAHRKLIQEPKRVLLLAGLNEVSHFLVSDQYPRRFGPFNGWRQFFHHMNKLDFGDTEDGLVIDTEEVVTTVTDHFEQRHLIVEMMDVVLDNWKLVTRALGSDLLFAFQPSPVWMQRAISAEEEKLFKFLDSVPENIYASHWGRMTELGKWFIAETESLCRSRDISFLDLNQALSERALDNHWLFVDRSHYNDQGSGRIVDELIRWQPLVNP